ncbi:MAG: hypothetical protein AAF206_00165 [Bacteroidota bacterium]
MAQSSPQTPTPESNPFQEILLAFGISMILPGILSFALVVTTAANHIFFVFLLFFFTFLFGMGMTMGLAIIRGIFHLFGSIFSKRSRKVLQEDGQETATKFRWTFVFVGLVLFGLGGFLFRDTSPAEGDMTHPILLAVGGGYGYLIAWMVKNGYIDPNDW